MSSILFVRTCLLFVLFVTSQSTIKAQKVKIGFRGGASFANFFNHNASGEKSPSSPVFINTNVTQPNGSSPAYPTNFFKDMRLGFFSGLYVDIKLNEKWAIETGLGYTQKGINLKYSTSSTFVNGDGTTTKQDHQMIRTAHTNYITMPGVFKYAVDKKQRLYILGGIYSAIALSSKIKAQDYSREQRYISTDMSLEATSENNITKADYRTVDVGLVGGGGFEIPLNARLSAGIDVRVNMGLINVPANYSQFGYLSFSATTKNINIETGIKISYSL